MVLAGSREDSYSGKTAKRTRSDRLQFLSGLEPHGFTRRNADFLPGPRIAADPRLTGFHVEDAEAAKLYALASAEGVFQGFKNGLDRVFGLRAGHARAGDDGVHDVELDQSRLQSKNSSPS